MSRAISRQCEDLLREGAKRACYKLYCSAAMASLVIEISTMAYRYPMAIRTFFYPTNQLPSVVAQTGQSPDQRLAVSRTKLVELDPEAVQV
jgi:hypothetical protein